MAVGWDTAAVVTQWPGLAPLTGDAGADACVVGLGASGLAAVEELVGRGLSVIGVDAGRVAAGAAGRNGGFLLGGPEPPLHVALADWGPCAVELYRETLAELDTLEATLPPGVLRRAGSIRLAGLPGPAADADEEADREREVADCAAQYAALRAHNIAVESYEGGELGRGVFLPDDAAVNPAVRALSIAARLEHRAALHEHTPVSRVERGVVTTTRGVVHAPVVIVAVDGRLEQVVPRLAGRMRTARLQMLATAPLPRRVDCPVYFRWGYDYAQQGDDGRIYIGGGRDRFAEQEWTDSTEPSASVQGWIEQVATRLAGAPVTVEDRWAASAGFTPDAKALCVRVDEGVVAIGGYSGTGNLVGPVAARAAVAYALDGTEPPSYFTS